MFDMFTQDFIFNALKVSIIMGLLLSYLGVHVVGRGIVFVDLALGQISMLGVAVANYFEKDPTVISIIFTMVGAFLLSFIKIKDKRLKQEAIIGIVYAVASAVTVLFISKAPHGESDISEVTLRQRLHRDDRADCYNGDCVRHNRTHALYFPEKVF